MPPRRSAGSRGRHTASRAAGTLSVLEEACTARATSRSRASPAGGSQLFPTAGEVPPRPSASDGQLGSGLPRGPSSPWSIPHHCQGTHKGSIPHHCQGTHKGNPTSSLPHSKVCNDTDYQLNQDALLGARHRPRTPRLTSPALFTPTLAPRAGVPTALQSSLTPTSTSGEPPALPDSPRPSLSWSPLLHHSQTPLAQWRHPQPPQRQTLRNAKVCHP